MEAGTLYLRVFLGAKGFRSSELDLLAASMGVSDRLSANPRERYFLTKTNVAALSFGNKLLFGSRYYSNLTEEQRRAAAAHEFGHVLGDGGVRKKRLVAPTVAVSILVAFAVFMGTESIVALMFASVLGFVGAAAVLSSIDSDRYLEHEMSCDRLAAAFVDGQALVQAIHVGESLQGANTSRLSSLWRGVGADTPAKLRIAAILGHRPVP